MVHSFCVRLSASAIVWAATTTAVHAILVTFETPSSPEHLGALYPQLSFTSTPRSEWSVSGGKAHVVLHESPNSADTCVLPGFLEPFAGIGSVVEATMGKPVGSSGGGYNVGLLIGSRAFIMHPGHGGGAFRIDSGLLSNQNIGFTPALGVDHLMQVHAFYDTVDDEHKYRVTITDTTNPLNNAYSITVTETVAPPTSPQNVGIRRSGGVGAAFFDNLSISTPHVRLSANNPTDGLRTDGTTVWADSGGTQSDAVLTGSSGLAPQFQQGVDGYGNTVSAYTYQFNSGNWAVIDDTPAAHAQDFLISGWYKLDRLPGVSGVTSWQIFAESGDYFTGAEWVWYNASNGQMYLQYSTGAGLGNDVTVNMPHGMEFLPGQFVHLAVAKEGSDVTMFVNGQSIGTQGSLSTEVANRDAGITLGTYHRYGNPGGGDWVNAQVGEFQFFDLATAGRTAAEIVGENYRGRYFDFHNRNPILLKAADVDGGGRTAAVANLWADLGGNENDAVMHGTPTVRTGWPPAPVMHFNEGDYLRIQDTPSTHVENFLVEGWFQFDRVPTAAATTWVTLAQNGDVFANQNQTPDEYGAEWLWHIGYDASAGTTDLNLSVWDATATAYGDDIRLTTPHALSVDDDFVHLAAARDGDRLVLFVDGNEVASQLLTGFTALNDGVAGISIGTYIRNGASGGDALSGRIGEFNIWDIDTFQMNLGEFVANQYTLGFPLYVPEPSSSALALLGLLWLTASRRRRAFTRAALERQGRQ